MKYRILLSFLLPFIASAQVIPTARRADWSNAGNIPFSFSQILPAVNVSSFGAAGDGITDDAAAIAAAIGSFNGTAGAVEFSAGTYLLRSPLDLPDSITLRGVSPGLVTLIFDLGGSPVHCIDISNNQSSSFIPVIAGFTKGSDSLVIANAQGIAPGDIVDLRQQNGAWDTQPASWAAYSVGQMAKVTGTNGNTIYLDQELRIDYNAALSPEVRRIIPVRNVSVECLAIERLDAATFGYNINFSHAYNCRIKGIESKKSAGAHIGVETSLHLSIAGSYFHHAFAYDGSGTRGYGVMLATHTSDCLIENNVFEHLRHSMMVKQGANGNVFAYNYSFDPFRAEIPTNAGGEISLHGHYAYANLFEGNIVQNIHIDQAWGPSGPYNTFFRNRAELYGIIMSSNSADTQNFVGNEITHSLGFYILNGNGHLEHGNNVQGTIQPASTAVLNEQSYYLTSPPPYWSLDQWSAIGTPNAPGSGYNPAYQNYFNGMPTECSQSTVGFDEAQDHELKIFPNPAHSFINIEAPVGNIRITIRDMAGRTLLSRAFEMSNGTITVQLPAHFAAGIYLLEAQLGNKLYRSKLIIKDQL